MAVKTKGIQEWCYANLDLIEESLEKNKKAVVFVSGASASGKSYSCDILKEFLDKKNIPSLVLSIDNYNRGISGIIVNKVNKNLFNNSLKNVELITKTVKNTIINTSFENKFCDVNLMKIKVSCKNLIPNSQMNAFLNGLNNEFSKINFDEPSVYNLKQTAKDVNNLLSNNKITEIRHTKKRANNIRPTQFLTEVSIV